MLRKLLAAIRESLKLVTRLIWVPMLIAGKLAKVPLTILDRVLSPSGGGMSEEAAAADDAAQQAQAAQRKAEKAISAGEWAGNLRSLARYRAEGREIDPALWDRLPRVFADYVRELSPEECKKLAVQSIRTISDYLEHRIPRIDGVRTIADAAMDADQRKCDHAAGNSGLAALRTREQSLDYLQDRVNAAMALARGTAPAMPTASGLGLKI